nr:MAG TPA_asm: hypothetical protein [Caudoviricetes sp.]
MICSTGLISTLPEYFFCLKEVRSPRARSVHIDSQHLCRLVER